MKTKILCILLVLLASATANAQEKINRTIEGITIGKTLKVQAARILKKKGLNIGNKIWDFRANPEEIPVQIDDTISHIGKVWNGVLFNTTSGKVVYRLCFQQNDLSKDEIDSTYTEVKLHFDKDYSTLKTEDTDYNTTYSDKQTEVSLWKTTDTSLRLCYYAIELDVEDEE